MPWELRIARVWAGSVLVLATSGRVSHADVANFQAALTQATGDADAVIIDLSGVDYLSGAGVAALNEASLRNGRENAILICGMQTPVRIACDLAGVLDTLPLETTRDECLDRLRGTQTFPKREPPATDARPRD